MPPRETKEQRLERERLEQERQNAENAEFLKNLPLTVFDLMVRADRSSHVSSVTPTYDGQVRSVTFKFFPENDDRSYQREYTVEIRDNYSWELRDDVENVVRELDRRDAAAAEAARMHKVAQDTYDSLSAEQRKALGLTHRP